MPKLTSEKKLEAIKKWLSENSVEYVENYRNRNGLVIDLWVPSLYIAVHIGDSQEFYMRVRKWCKPFFVRESDTKAYLIEKMQNCCVSQMLYLQKRYERKKKAEEKNKS